MILTVILDEDVAQVFTTPESVNKALRALIKGIPPAMNDLTIEQRLATLEQTVAELKRQINDAPASNNWLEKVIGSISDESAFLEALEYGRSLRQADKPKNQRAKAQRQAVRGAKAMLPDTDKSKEEADNLQRTQVQIEAVEQLKALQAAEELEALQIDAQSQADQGGEAIGLDTEKSKEEADNLQ
ncbi:hypothetical protein JYQ62_16230 [Nostoc sp. UHCC 0702]|nr:hypothetical protein JYQ62_16230 [Nostoc sp. UHCC 0702]